MWCKTTCEDWQIKCCGGIDNCGCKIKDTCIEKPLCCDGKTRCEHYCPEECGPCTFPCPQPKIDCCPQPDKCEPMVKSINPPYEYCEEQHCPKCCEANETLCEGWMDPVTGCREEPTCVPLCPPVSNSGVPCPEEDNCPVCCNEFNEVKCERTEIFHGKYAGCWTAECCVPPAKDCHGNNCPVGSASHPCPEKECPPCHYLCPPRKVPHTCCLEQAHCTECARNYEGECCSAAVTCHAVCEDHERECRPSELDEEGCPYPAVCVPVTRNLCTGEECEPHCPGVCRHPEQTGPCLGELTNCGCREPSFCHPNEKKKWGVGCYKEWCPGWCPKYCEEGEMCCPSVEDPCNGCPTEPRCVPIAKDVNGNNCPPSSASHGCDIDCRTADVGTGANKTEPGGYEVICPPLKDDAQCGCLAKLDCRTRVGWFDETGCQQWCPAHSVCDKECPKGTKKCSQGFDENGCKREPVCIQIPLDDVCQLPCKNFVCPPCCDEAKEKYCNGLHVWDSVNSQMCPEPDYCVERKLLANGDRCEGHCKKECPAGKIAVPQPGVDSRGCPFEDNCEPDPSLGFSGAPPSQGFSGAPPSEGVSWSPYGSWAPPRG